MNHKRIILIGMLLLTLQTVAADSVWGCPTCKNSLHDGLALGYAVSILFMMGMPFIILGFWVVTIVRLRRQFVVNQTTNKSEPWALASAQNHQDGSSLPTAH